MAKDGWVARKLARKPAMKPAMKPAKTANQENMQRMSFLKPENKNTI